LREKEKPLRAERIGFAVLGLRRSADDTPD
jgi:hypothetical protein